MLCLRRMAWITKSVPSTTNHHDLQKVPGPVRAHQQVPGWIIAQFHPADRVCNGMLNVIVWHFVAAR